MIPMAISFLSVIGKFRTKRVSNTVKKTMKEP